MAVVGPSLRQGTKGKGGMRPMVDIGNAYGSAARGLLAATLATLLLATGVSAAPAGWSSAKRAFAERFGPPHSMVLDSTGSFHIAVEGRTSSGIWYVSNVGGEGWFAIKVTHKQDRDPAIAIDGSDRVTIAFVRRDPVTLKPLGVWTVSNVTGTFVVSKRYSGRVAHPSVQVAAGSIHLAFQGPGHSLLYRTNATGAWATTTLAASGCCSGGPSLALSGTKPRIAWSRRTASGGHGKLRFSALDSGSWSSQTIDTHATSEPALAVRAGLPYVAYLRDGGGTYFASPAQGGWGQLAVGSTYRQPPDIAVSAGGVISIVEGKSSRLRLVRMSGGTTTNTVLTATGNDFDPEIALHGGKARVIFNSASGTSADGIWYMKES